MNFTYTSDPQNNMRDRVRFLIGDNIKEECLVADEEIDFALDKYTQNVHAACRLLCNAIAAKYAKKQDVRVSNYSTGLQSVYDKYRKLAEYFGTLVAATGFRYVMPAASEIEKQKNVDNTDAVQPAFKRGLFDNPDAPSFTDLESLT